MTFFLGAGDRAEATAGQRPRPLSEPAHTITSRQTAGFRTPEGWRGLTVAEAAILQSFPAHIERPAHMSDLIALDLFAGTGWGVACQRLGIEEYGVELMPEAVATREANGMTTLYGDVWDGLLNGHDAPGYSRLDQGERDVVRGFYDLLIASPPCQTFSVAGKGAGRKALDDVLLAIAGRDYLDPAKLKAFGEKHDDRTALVLTPLAHVARDLPRLVVFEQVPTVLPVWEACAEVMREWGYSVVTGVLNSEQYGVPQTRKRAILIARWDAEAKMPTPTHSRYYSRDPQRLDPGVLPWVSMAEALGWGMTARPYPTVSTGTEAGGTDPAALGGSGARGLVKAEREAGRWERGDDWHEGYPTLLRSNYSTETAGKTPPPGNKLPRSERETDKPALTVTSRAWANEWRSEGETPATTVQGVDRVWPRGHKVNSDDIRRLGEEEANARYGHRNTSTAMRVTIEEASALQSYPEGFRFEGAKGKQFLQVGNAVPPLLAEAILRSLL